MVATFQSSSNSLTFPDVYDILTGLCSYPLLVAHCHYWMSLPAIVYVSLIIVWTVRILLSVMSLDIQYFLVAHVHLLGSMLSSGAVDTIRY